MSGLTCTKFSNDGHKGVASQSTGRHLFAQKPVAEKTNKIALTGDNESELNDITGFGSKSKGLFPLKKFEPTEIHLGDRFGYPQFYREKSDNVTELVRPQIIKTDAKGNEYADIDGDKKPDFIFTRNK